MELAVSISLSEMVTITVTIILSIRKDYHRNISCYYDHQQYHSSVPGRKRPWGDFPAKLLVFI